MKQHLPFLLTDLDLSSLRLIEQISASIGALNTFVSGGFLASCWQERAAWAGYARALQLHGTEIDEIDVISWACDVPIPGRVRFDTVVDPFAGFPGWRALLATSDDRHWREDLPFSPALPPNFSEAPVLLRAVAILGQYAATTGTLAPWLMLPLLLHRMGLTPSPLPCLVAGDKAFRFAPRDPNAVVCRTLRDLRQRAADGLAMAIDLEADRRRWIKVLGEERKPGALRALGALALKQPVFRPEALARQLGLTRSGAGKLLDRAADLGFVQEVSGRRSWRVYMVRGIARRLGFAPALRGRPAHPPVLPRHDPLGEQLAAFDAEMADFAARYPTLSETRTEDPGWGEDI